VAEPRIYITIGTFHPWVGGAETQALLQAKRLRARGDEATIVTLRHERFWPRRETIDGVPVFRFGGAVAGSRRLLPAPVRKAAYLAGAFALGWSLWRRRGHYDLLCVYQLNLLTLPVSLAAVLARKPVVGTVRSAGRTKSPLTDAPGQPGEATSTRGRQTTDPGTGDVYVLERLGAPIYLLTRALLRRAGARLVVLSSRMRDDAAIRKLGLPIEHIPNGVDTTHFTPISRGREAAGRARTVVCVARLAHPKGVDILLKAWRHVHERAPDARLVVVGGGELQRDLKRLADELGIQPSVEFTGARPDVATQLHRGRIGVLASRWEGMPNALLEAMACGLACVATRVSGSEDLIDDGVSGLLVQPEDPAALAGALLRLLNDPALARDLGSAARAAVERDYAVDRVTDRYIGLYHDLLAAHSRPAEPYPVSTTQ